MTTILSSSVESICAFSLFAPAPERPANIVPEPEAPAPVAEPVAASVATLSPMQRQQVENIADAGRNEVIKAIKTALQHRSGKQWSVTGGRGTAWGWIRIDAPPSRATWGCRLKAGAVMDRPEDYEECDTGEHGRNMSPADRAELGTLLGLDAAHCQGVSIPASRDYQRVYICRALHGHAGPFTAEQYWD